MATVKFYIRSKSKKKLTVPLHLRLYEGRSLDEWIKLPIQVDPATWSNKTGKFKQILKDPSPELKEELEKIQDRLDGLEKQILKGIMSAKIKDKQWINNTVEKFFNPIAQETAKTLFGYIQKYIDDAKEGNRLTYRGGKKFSAATVKSIKSMQTELNKYQEDLQEKIAKGRKLNYRPKRFPIDFDDITIDFYNDWIRFFNEKNYSPNTIGKHIKWLKTILKESKENGLHINSEFERRAFKPISSDVVSVYLNETELKKILDLNLSENPELNDARDVFLVGCYTAQRFSDYSRIDRISELDDGTQVIKLTQKKTGTPVTIPIRPELLTILKKYEITNNEIKLPKISEQHLNRQIKKVAAKAEINDLIEVKKTKGGLVIRPSYPKSSLITSHTARRSGCSNLFNAGVASQYIMRISGHKTEREFLKYLKLTPDEVAKKLSKHDYFIGTVLKVAK